LEEESNDKDSEKNYKTHGPSTTEKSTAYEIGFEWYDTECGPTQFFLLKSLSDLDAKNL